MRIADFSLLAILAVVSCGPQPPPEGPFILTDVASLGFGTQFNTGTPIGTSPTEAVNVSNAGLSELSITDVTQAGDTAFFMQLEGQVCRRLPTGSMPTPDCDLPSSVLPIKVRGKQNTFVRVFFTPSMVRVYQGTLTIKSNADNAKDLVIRLCGIGVNRNPDGGATEGPDAGCER